MSGCLYVVATPLGHLDDITIRALHTLKSVALVAAEDTRRTGNLLRHFGIATPLTSVHEHNEGQKIDQLLARLGAGDDVAVVSDAGTPLLSDPGQLLVARAAAAGVRIVPIPGPSSIIAALSVAGFPANRFAFFGFPPTRGNDRTRWFEGLDSQPDTIVAFEAPHRILRFLGELARISVNRPIVVCRELTKIHEEIRRGTAHEAVSLQVNPRGEFTIVCGPRPAAHAQPSPVSDEDVRAYYGRLTELDAKTPRGRMAMTAARFGLSTNEVYERLTPRPKPPSP